ncbi:MAG: class I SAM-dependent methyltransferase [Bacteroidales bacterium]|nr:class I SAM-dependent methyltransferase [Bacteroidales bacterium]
MHNCPWCGTPSEHEYLKLKDYFLTMEDFSVFECDHCHLLFTVPRPESDKLGSYYQSEQYFSHQENKTGLIPRIYEIVKSFNIRRKIKLATANLQIGSALDIGCGVGDFLVALQKKGWHVQGIEPSSDAKAIAQKRLGFYPLCPDDYATLPSSSFDLITMWHVLEHVEDLHFQVDQLNRLLKPGGRLVIALPNFKSYDAYYYKAHWAAWDVPRHLNHFSSESIQSIFSESNFKSIDIQKLRWDSYYISYLSESYLHHSLPLVRGLWRGLCSNISAYRSKQYSSLVYRFSKM